jgi:hypothetical protein
VCNPPPQLEAAEGEETEQPWYERLNPVDYVGDRARRLYDTVGAVGESIVKLAIYFTISTIVLPLGTLWLLARLGSAVFSTRSP